MNAGIYVIENLGNGHKYVGKTRDFKTRRIQHFRLLKHNKHFNSYLQNSYNKWGKAYFEFRIIERVADPGFRSEREWYWIRKMKADFNFEPGYSGEEPDDIYHDRFTKIVKKGKKYDRPKWHGWVYGGERNPVLSQRYRYKPDDNESWLVTNGNKT